SLSFRTSTRDQHQITLATRRRYFDVVSPQHRARDVRQVVCRILALTKLKGGNDGQVQNRNQPYKHNGIELLDRLATEHPIFLAPMAGGPGTPELVAAVSNAGGLGSVGGASSTPQALSEDIARIRTLTNRPSSTNFVARAYRSDIEFDASLMPKS